MIAPFLLRDRVPKPAPEMYYECMKECGAEPQTTCIVEDSPVGIEGAERTGARVIRVAGPAEVVQVVRTLMEVV